MLVVVLGVVLLGGGFGWTMASNSSLANRAMTAAGIGDASPTYSSTFPPPKVIDCREQVRAGDRAVAAAQQSYQDWYEHVYAQIDLEKGKINLAEANRIWDRTHSRGSADMAAFDANKITYDNQKTACSKVPTQVSPKWADDVRNCEERAKVIEKTLAAGTVVADDWSKHTLQEREKQTTNPLEYHRLWVALVEKAPAHLKTFRNRYADYQKAPECFPDQGE